MLLPFSMVVEYLRHVLLVIFYKQFYLQVMLSDVWPSSLGWWSTRQDSNSFADRNLTCLFFHFISSKEKYLFFQKSETSQVVLHIIIDQRYIYGQRLRMAIGKDIIIRILIFFHCHVFVILMCFIFPFIIWLSFRNTLYINLSKSRSELPELQLLSKRQNASIHLGL